MIGPGLCPDLGAARLLEFENLWEWRQRSPPGLSPDWACWVVTLGILGPVCGRGEAELGLDLVGLVPVGRLGPCRGWALQLLGPVPGEALGWPPGE